MQIVTIDIGHHFDGGENSPHLVDYEIARAMREAGFEGYTRTSGTGYWRGEREPQTSVRVYIEAARVDALRTVAGVIRDALAQESVGFTVQDAEVAFV